MCEQKVNHFWAIVEKGFNSLIQKLKKVPSLESQIFSILGVKKIFKKFNSLSFFFEKSPILWVLLWRGFNSLRQIFENPVHSFESSFSEGLNSLGDVENKGSILWVTLKKKSSILWVVVKKIFNSLSHTEKISTLWVMLKKVPFLESCKKKVQFFQSYSKKKVFNPLPHLRKKFNPLGHFEKKVQSFGSFWERVVQSFESYSRKKFNPLSHVEKGSNHWVMFKRRFKRRFNWLNHVQKKVEVFESC